ncbi:MAG TPA: 3-deoxy-manno-octulosonate cytidylyltransferase [Cytophagales bacterium]|nr:3-deoxy-manno-octulosonate cytidylyltransferase [Cytophagales bacterium]
MKILGIIPARYASSRFPAKALADIKGKTMIRRVYEQAEKASSLHKVVVATDHQDIYDHVKTFGGEVVMTSVAHQSGTDRCAEVLDTLSGFDYVVNIQGDEPFIDPVQIDTLTNSLDGIVQIASLCIQIKDEEVLFSANAVKVIFNKAGNAIYFSRNPIPYNRSFPHNEWLNHHSYYKHIGMYAYRSDILKDITLLLQSSLETAESLEQLRWIENGYKVKMEVSSIDSPGIDTPDDLKRAIETYF